MDCRGCRSTKPELYCNSCLEEGLKNHAQAHHILQTQLNASKSRCEKILYGTASTSASSGPSGFIAGRSAFIKRRTIESNQAEGSSTFSALRQIRGEVFILEKKRESIQSSLSQHRIDSQTLRDELQTRRQSLLQRRQNLSRLPIHPSQAHLRETIQSTSTQIRLIHEEQAEDKERLRAARVVLCKEAVRIFGVKRRDETRSKRREEEVGNRSMSGLMEISGWALPLPQEFLGIHSNHLNAALTHTVHLLHLLTTYLNITLPFNTTWSAASSYQINPNQPAARRPGFSLYDKLGEKMIGRPGFGSDSWVFWRRVGIVPPSTGARANEGSQIGQLKEEEEEVGDLKVWKRKAQLYVSTSRERWKRRQASNAHNIPHPHGQTEPDPSTTNQTDQKGAKETVGKDKYQIKEDQLVLSYTMLIYNVCSLAWVCGVDLSKPWEKEGEGSEEGRNQNQDDGDDAEKWKVDWDRIIDPLRVIEEIIRSPGLGRNSHSRTNEEDGTSSPSNPDSTVTTTTTSLNYIPLPLNFPDLLQYVTDKFNSTGRKVGEEVELGGDDWDLV